MAQYRELQAFAQFGSDLDETTQRQLNRGERVVEMLKQNQYSPMNVPDQIAVVYAASRGYLDELPIGKVKKFETDFLEHFNLQHPEFRQKVEEHGLLTDSLETVLDSAIRQFLKAHFEVEVATEEVDGSA